MLRRYKWKNFLSEAEPVLKTIVIVPNLIQYLETYDLKPLGYRGGNVHYLNQSWSERVKVALKVAEMQIYLC